MRFALLGGTLSRVLDHRPDLRVHLCLTEVAFNTKVDRQTHSRYCYGAQHQKYKQ